MKTTILEQEYNMENVYGYCLVCANSQKDLDICALCGSGYVIQRDVTDYEVHLFDLVETHAPNDEDYELAPSSLPPANEDKRFVGGNQDSEILTRTGDPVRDDLIVWDKDVKNVDVDPKNYSTKNDGHERPGDGPKDPGKAIPAPVGGSMDNKETTVAALNDTAMQSDFIDPENDTFWEAEETNLLVRSERKTKTVGGQHLTADKFACVGNIEDTSTWKLPIHDANHVRNALARYNQAAGCNTPEVRAKILRAAKRFNIDAQSLKEKHQALYQESKTPEPVVVAVEIVAETVAPTKADAETNDDKPKKPVEAGTDYVPEAAQTSTDEDPDEAAKKPEPKVEEPVKSNSDEMVENDFKNHDEKDDKKEAAPTAELKKVENADYKNYMGDKEVSTDKVSVEISQKTLNEEAKQARKAAIAKLQTYLKSSNNYEIPKKKGNVDEAQLATKASGVPTPQGDTTNGNLVEVTDKNGAAVRTVPSAESLNTKFGLVTPSVPENENHTVVVKDGDSFVGDGDKPGDATTRGPDADNRDIRATVVIQDVEKTQDLTERKLMGRTAIKTLRFAKAFWKTSEGILSFLVNEGIWTGYHVDASGQIVNQIKDTGGYFEVEALPAGNFKAGTFVDHCIASFGGDCAIIATIGEVASTPGLEPYDARVQNLASPAPITKAFVDYHIKRIAYLEKEGLKTNQELAGTKAKLEETESLLAAALNDKKSLSQDNAVIKAELDEKVAEARLTARLEDLPNVVKAQLKRNSHRDDIIRFLRTANDQEWELARRTFALAKHQSFTELSEEEGKLPVGGAPTNDSKSLQEYLR